jgi:hypothetical protein
MTNLFWVHEDHLHLPADIASAEEWRVVFIWDDDFLTQQFYGLKRRVFLYECLLDLPIDIIAGPRRTTLEKMMHDADQLLTWNAQNPETRHLIASLGSGFTVTVLEPEPFIMPQATETKSVPRRFFKYWKSAAPRALAHDGQAPD